MIARLCLCRHSVVLFWLDSKNYPFFNQTSQSFLVSRPMGTNNPILDKLNFVEMADVAFLQIGYFDRPIQFGFGFRHSLATTSSVLIETARLWLV